MTLALWWTLIAAPADTASAAANPALVDQFKFLGAAVFMLGAGFWFIKQAGKLVRDVSGDAHKGVGPRPKAIDAATRALLVQRGVPAAQVEQMSAGEAGFLLAMLEEHGGAQPGTAAGAAPVARPGMVLHCPACGTALGTGPVPLPADVTCGICERRVTARVGGAGRVVVSLGPPR